MVVSAQTYRVFQGTLYKAHAITKRLYGVVIARQWAEEIALRAWQRHLELDDESVRTLYQEIRAVPVTQNLLRSKSETEDWM